jgi:serine/threonine protein kinase
MVRPDGKAKLLDFGLAFAPGEPLPDDPSVVGGKGYIVGTMDFIAPEQAGDAVAARPASDLYSLGCSLYFALTGTVPFPGGSSQDKIRWQRNFDPVPLAELNPDLPRELVHVVERLMTKSPADRPANAAAARELLLPFATVPAPAANLSVRDAVGAVDSPDAYPELWTEDEAERPKPSPIPLSEVEVRPDEVPWKLAVGIVVGVIALALLFTLLAKL